LILSFFDFDDLDEEEDLDAFEDELDAITPSLPSIEYPAKGSGAILLPTL
jgi:hypothetical protein